MSKEKHSQKKRDKDSNVEKIAGLEPLMYNPERLPIDVRPLYAMYEVFRSMIFSSRV